MSATAKLTPAADAAPSRLLAGIGLAILGLFLFGANNAAMKTVVTVYPVPEMIAFRSVFSLLLLAPLLRLEQFRAAFRAANSWLHLVRMTMSSMEITCFFVAVSVLPLADVSTIYLASPIFVTALSPFLLGERVGWRRWVAVAIGFAGVLVALQPSRAAISPAALIALAGALLFSLVVIATRRLRGASNLVLVTLQIAAALLVSLAQANARWIMPSWPEIGLLCGIAVMSVSGFAAFNQSLRITPASVVTPYQYTSLIWAALFGFFIFGETPTASTVAGAAVIVGAGLFIVGRERRKTA